MKTAQEWNWEHTKICANDPAVHGQLLPTPQMVNFLKRVQADALLHASKLVHDMSRGTKSEDRAAAIDEARDLIADEAKTVSLSQTVTAHQTTDLRTLTDDNAREIADLSYRMADAMIARRSSAQPNKKLTEPATR